MPDMIPPTARFVETLAELVRVAEKTRLAASQAMAAHEEIEYEAKKKIVGQADALIKGMTDLQANLKVKAATQQ